MELALSDPGLVPDGAGPIAYAIAVVFALIWYALVVIGLWKVFAKAGYAGILAVIPIVNLVVLVRIAGLSGWFTLLYPVPIAGLVVGIVVALRVGARFGQGGAFSFFLLYLFPYVGYMILGFGAARPRDPRPGSAPAASRLPEGTPQAG